MKLQLKVFAAAATVAASFGAGMPAAAQQVRQTTVMHNAPVTAIALGDRARATVDINVTDHADAASSVRQSVVVHRPITVIAAPYTHASVRLGGRR